MAVIADVGRVIGSSLDIGDVYQHFADQLGTLLEADRTVIRIIDAGRGTFQHAYVAGDYIPESKVGQEFPLAGSVLDHLARTKKGLLLCVDSGEQIVGRFLGMRPSYEAGFRSFLSVPLILRNAVYGSLHLESKRLNAYTVRDLALVEHVGQQITGAIANAGLYARLEREAEQYRSLYENTPVMMHAIDSEGRLVNVNRPWLESLGYERGEVIGRRSIEFLTDASRRYATEVAVPEFWRSGSAVVVEYQMVKKNGEVIDVLLSAVVQRDEAGEESQSLAFLVDVTRRKRAEAEAGRLSVAVATATEAVFIVGMDAQILFVNPAAETMFVYEPGKMLGTSVLDLRPEATAGPTGQAILEATADQGRWTGELLLRKKEGSEFPVRLSTGLIRDTDGRPIGIVGIATDISERRRLEEQLLQSQKIETVGRFAGGLAHDFNNILTVIVNYTYLASMKVSGSSMIRDYLRQVQAAVEHAARLTSRLLTLSRYQIIEPRVLSLNGVILDTSVMLRRLIGEDIELVTLLESEPGLVSVDPGQMEQVLLNLVINARDAMPGGGKLLVETANVSLEEGPVWVSQPAMAWSLRAAGT